MISHRAFLIYTIVKYLRGYNIIKENKDYFKTILKKELADPNEVNSDRKAVVDRLIARAKINLDSNPSEEKVKIWTRDIESVIHRYIRNDYSFDFKPEKGDFNYMDPMEKERREQNSTLIVTLLDDETSYIYKTIEEIPDYYKSQVGEDTIIDYVKSEEKTQFFQPKKKFNTQRYPNEDEIQFLQRKGNIESDWEGISKRLIHYFLKRLIANIPVDKVYTEEEMVKFISTYVEKFLYLYLIPMSKH